MGPASAKEKSNIQSDNVLDHDEGQHTAADGEGKPGIGMDVLGSADVISVVLTDGLHHRGQGVRIGSLVHFVLHEGEKMILKVHLVFPVLV